MLEESGQWHENVDRTHLALASGKIKIERHFQNVDNSNITCPFIKNAKAEANLRSQGFRHFFSLNSSALDYSATASDRLCLSA